MLLAHRAEAMPCKQTGASKYGFCLRSAGAGRGRLAAFVVVLVQSLHATDGCEAPICGVAGRLRRRPAGGCCKGDAAPLGGKSESRFQVHPGPDWLEESPHSA